MSATLELENGRDVTAVQLVETPVGQAAMYSRVGPGKEGPNEDACAVLPYGDEGCVLVVADGVGGERDGSEASRITIQALSSSLDEAVKTDLPIRTAILNGIDHANAEVIALGTGAATTIVAVQIAGGVMRPYHVGDSMVLVVGQRGKVKHQNIPHGPVGYAVEAGLLDEAEALHHEERNIVTNVVGASDMRIEVGPRLTLAARDTVLLASDGLSDNLYAEEIVNGIRVGGLEAATRELAERCRKRMTGPRPGRPSKPDDLTLIAFRPTR